MNPYESPKSGQQPEQRPKPKQWWHLSLIEWIAVAVIAAILALLLLSPVHSAS